jgi:hypothetical protein
MSVKFGPRIQPAFVVKTDSKDAILFLEYLKEQRESEDIRYEAHIQFIEKLVKSFKEEAGIRIVSEHRRDYEQKAEYTKGIKSIIDNFQTESRVRQGEMIAHLGTNTKVINDNSKALVTMSETVKSLEEAKDDLTMVVESNTKALDIVVQIFEQKKRIQFVLAPLAIVIGVILGFLVAVIALKGWQ